MKTVLPNIVVDHDKPQLNNFMPQKMCRDFKKEIELPEEKLQVIRENVILNNEKFLKPRNKNRRKIRFNTEKGIYKTSKPKSFKDFGKTRNNLGKLKANPSHGSKTMMQEYFKLSDPNSNTPSISSKKMETENTKLHMFNINSKRAHNLMMYKKLNKGLFKYRKIVKLIKIYLLKTSYAIYNRIRKTQGKEPQSFLIFPRAFKTKNTDLERQLRDIKAIKCGPEQSFSSPASEANLSKGFAQGIIKKFKKCMKSKLGSRASQYFSLKGYRRQSIYPKVANKSQKKGVLYKEFLKKSHSYKGLSTRSNSGCNPRSRNQFFESVTRKPQKNYYEQLYSLSSKNTKSYCDFRANSGI
ncbi:unnamed protein product [Moneuplotes crassus]|uniref:Uncharacterized protein n=1 Tax=Euplotes crassus TaxID=5936 RepID=A0AAD1UI59_EUPCR|nr:unnamed protein product [Moneuplotes crassus]